MKTNVTIANIIALLIATREVTAAFASNQHLARTKLTSAPPGNLPLSPLRPYTDSSSTSSPGNAPHMMKTRNTDNENDLPPQTPQPQKTTALSAASTTTTLTTTNPDKIISSSSQQLTPQTQSVISMTTAMALHFFGYEFARSASLSLFTSVENGFTSSSAFPLAMAAVTPLSTSLLMLYGNSLDRDGPRVTLKRTSVFCASVLAFTAFVLQSSWSSSSSLRVPLVKALVGFNFVFQNCYATLLYSQYFSFMGSVVSVSQSQRWFTRIAGVSSISSTIAGALLPMLIGVVGVKGLLYVAGGALIASMWCGDLAYGISDKYGFNPTKELEAKKKANKEMKKSEQNHNIFRKASSLFSRVPTLGALFAEVLSFYGVAAIINMCFVTKLKMTIADDALRAAFMGKFFAMVNGTCGILQFLILPFVMKRLHPSWIWKIMPLILITCTAIQWTSLSLFWISGSFFLVKVMDYSARAALTEMIYVPLDFESRFVGKEVIGMFGNGFGKSGTSLILAGLTSAFKMGVPGLSVLSSMACAAWMTFSLRLTRLLPKDKKQESPAKVE